MVLVSDLPLARRLGTGDAVVVGLTAMLGAGVFVVFAPAAEAAGTWLLGALGLAAAIAFCNAVASAQLASCYPSSGGTYLFGREVLGPWWGFTAGWGFVVGKTASCAAMAMTVGAYAFPGVPWAQRVAGIVAVALLTLATLRGITRTARVARLLLAVTFAVLILVVLLSGRSALADPVWTTANGGVPGVLQAAGLLFFAFAGYARIATLAEEVRRPAVLGRAILTALAIAVTTYAVVGVTLLATLGDDLGSSVTPLADAADAAGAPWAAPIVRLGAIAAALGALLALLTGVGRTTLAMARERDLPGWLGAVDPRRRVPHHAEIAVGLVVMAVVALTDLRGAIGFSSFGVLIYYAVANLAAYRQPPAQRRWPRALQIGGLAGCLVLAASLPLSSALVGLAVIVTGVGGRWVALRLRAGTP